MGSIWEKGKKKIREQLVKGKALQGRMVSNEQVQKKEGNSGKGDHRGEGSNS